MAIVLTKDDSIFDLLRKLQSNYFEIFAIEYSKLKTSYRVKINRDKRFVKIINTGSELLIMSEFAPCIFTNKVLLFDDLSYEEIK